jgi:non-specific serine/threonine protein kinase
VPLRQGDVQRAAAPLSEALTLFRETGDAWGIASALQGLGQIAFDQGDDARATALWSERLALSRELGNRGGTAHALELLGLIALRQREWRRAAARFHESLVLRQEMDDREGVAFSIQTFARLAARFRPERAVRLAGAAGALRAAIGARLSLADEAALEHDLAGARRRLGEAPAAAAWAAGEMLTVDQAIGEALVVARELEAPAPSSPNTARRHPDGLTPREREVAALAARGLSNREIAAHLVITEGTARIHVERVLGKLGLRSRAQLAAQAAEFGLAGRGSA